MVLKNQLNAAFDGRYTKRVARYYKHLICELLRYHNPTGKITLPPEQMTQYHIDEWLAYLVRPLDYSRSTTNNAKLAIQAYFEHIGNPMRVKLVSTRHKLTIPDTISPAEFTRLCQQLTGIYKLAALDIYALTQPAEVLEKYATSRGAMRRQTLNDKIKAAALAAGIVNPVTVLTIRNSGIVEYLRATNDVEMACRKTGLARSTMLRYWRLARK